MYGVFTADGAPGRNLEPHAWGGRRPAQVRVKQYFKFCPLPWTAFKRIFQRNGIGSKIGLRITAEKTYELITKFIITTRLVLGHRVMCKLSGELGRQMCSDWVKEKLLLLHYSSTWHKELIASGRPAFRFHPEFMLRGGTFHDFILAIRSMGTGRGPQENTTFFFDDWKHFLKLISELTQVNSYLKDTRNAPDQMEDVILILSQASSPVCDTGDATAEAAKWFGSEARSIVNKWDAPAALSVAKKRDAQVSPKLLQLINPLSMQRTYPGRNDVLPPPNFEYCQPMARPLYAQEKMSKASSETGLFAGNIPSRRRQKLYNDVPELTMEDLYQEDTGNLPFASIPDCLSDDDLDDFTYGSRNMYPVEALKITEDIPIFTHPESQPICNLQSRFTESPLGTQNTIQMQDTYLNEESAKE